MSATADPSSIKDSKRCGPHFTDRITARSTSLDGPDEHGEQAYYLAGWHTPHGREALGGRPFGDGTAPGPVPVEEAVR